MKKMNTIIAVLGLALVGFDSFAAEKSVSISPTKGTPTVYNRTYAIGVAAGLNKKSTGTEKAYNQTSGEVVGYSYSEINENFVVRPGIRLGYTPGQEPAGAESISISENDFKSAAEVALLWRKLPVIPSLSMGAGMIYRSVSVSTRSPVVSNQSSIGGSSILPTVHGQLSVIVPIRQGKLEFAPFARYTHVFSDSRIGWFFGLESSIALF
jgi:hypothetical protein